MKLQLPSMRNRGRRVPFDDIRRQTDNIIIIPRIPQPRQTTGLQISERRRRLSLSAPFWSPPEDSEIGSYLYHSHGQSRFLSQLFPDVPGGFRRLGERRLQDLELFRLYRGPGPPAFRPGSAVVGAFVFCLGVSRFWVPV